MPDAKQFINTLKIIRLPNLFIIALIIYLLHEHILVRIFISNGLTPELDRYHVLLLILFSIVITLSGYLVNDIYDIEADKVNKPGQNWALFLGKTYALGFYVFLIISSIYLSYLLASDLDKWNYIWLCPFMLCLLWIYSRFLKRAPLLGNLLVSIFCALIVLLVFLSEDRNIPILVLFWYKDLYFQVIYIFSFYGLFAFLTTLIREVAKDIQDMNGDLKLGANTFPIKYGFKISKQITYILLIVLVLLSISLIFLFKDYFYLFQVFYFIFLIIVPTLYTMHLVQKSSVPEDYNRISLILKLIMLTGTLFLLTLPI